MSNYRLLIHLHEKEKWKMAINNSLNLLKDLNDDHITIEVVANGAAVLSYIEDQDLLKEMDSMVEKGVIFTACQNSLNDRKIPIQSLPTTVVVVPSAVGELVKKQHEGYAYIKL